MNSASVQPHINISKDKCEYVALVMGDPKRVVALSKYCDFAEEIAYNREYKIYKCTKNGVNFLVASHGVGGSGAAICFEELIAIGVKVIIRAGTCGSLKPNVHVPGTLINCYAAAREDGVSRLLSPKGLPAAANPDVFEAIRNAAQNHAIAENKIADSNNNYKKNGVICKSGVVVSSDLFYKPSVLPSTLDMWRKCNCDAVEMEVATLYIVAMLHGIKAGAICVIDGSPFHWEESGYDPSHSSVEEGKKALMKIVIEATVNLTKSQQ